MIAELRRSTGRTDARGRDGVFDRDGNSREPADRSACSSGIVDIAEPLLERLASNCGELVRLSIVDGDRLTWVAKSQGTRQAGQRYDPDMGMDVQLSCTSSGHAWLMTMSDSSAR